MALRIEDYGLIGDCHRAALVGRDGSIDWLCWPRFDSGACFAALLGGPENGRWLIAPAGKVVKSSRAYREDTLILETEFETAEGAVTLIDFMPIHDKVADLVRLVVGRRGKVAMHTELVIRYDYGTTIPWVSKLEDGALRAVAGPDMLVLRTPVELTGKDMKTLADFEVSAGQTIPFVLTYGPSHRPPPAPIDPAEQLKNTERFWVDWSGKCADAGPWSAAVKRSLITLKAMIYEPTGGIVAAPTTSLPEQIGGVRNWDYRYCWLRDATLTLLALMHANYFEEADAWRGWLERAVAGSAEQMQIMYGVAGERRLAEWEVPWLKGFEASGPVRIGNAAAAQMQLDVYGEVMDALHQAREGGLKSDENGWAIQQQMVEHLSQVWDQPDQGMWEVRGPPQHFTYSKVMAWVAVDRALRGVEKYGLPGPLDDWRKLRDTIHQQVCAQGFDAQLNSFVQSYGSKELDASLMLIPLTGFLPVEDPRVRGTLEAIEKGLAIDGLVRRYHTHRTDDGLPPGEGFFLACSFWRVDALTLLGRHDEAKEMFEHLLALRNDLGLLSEEYYVGADGNNRMLGNFPQAFSHIGLVNSAFNLTRAQNPANQRADGQAQQAPQQRKVK